VLEQTDAGRRVAPAAAEPTDSGAGPGEAGEPSGLRVLHVVEAFSTGVFEAVRLIADAAAEAGHEVHVAHAKRPWTPEDFKERFDARVSFHRLAWGVRRRPSVLLQGTLQLGRLLRSESWDIVHFHSTFAGIAGAVARPRGIRTVYTPHGYAFLMDSISPRTRLIARTLERVVARRVTVLGAVSHAEAEEARALGARTVEVIHNGITELDALDPDRDVDASELAGRAGVVAAGRMSAQRQPQAVAAIFAALPAGTPTWWLGDDADPEAAESMRRDGTTVTGWLPREEVLDRMRRARVYLHWTAWDGHPLSVLEAISQGTVVVAHDIPPVREILAEDQVRPSSASAVSLIEELLADEEKLVALRNSQARAAYIFSGRAMTASWLNLYSRLATAATK
jgi:glycosyltransferase involved in cell wall biosynthesis